MKMAINMRFGNRRGQALAEMALSLPLLVLVMVCAVDLGRVFYTFQAVESAAASGAEYASASYHNAALLSNIQSIGMAQLSDITNLSPVITSSVTASNVAVTCSAVYSTYLPWKTIFQWFGSTDTTGNAYQVSLQRTVNMRILQ
jgi:Flp pilus assembly protein TadG